MPQLRRLRACLLSSGDVSLGSTCGAFKSLRAQVRCSLCCLACKVAIGFCFNKRLSITAKSASSDSPGRVLVLRHLASSIKVAECCVDYLALKLILIGRQISLRQTLRPNSLAFHLLRGDRVHANLAGLHRACLSYSVNVTNPDSTSLTDPIDTAGLHCTGLTNDWRLQYRQRADLLTLHACTRNRTDVDGPSACHLLRADALRTNALTAYRRETKTSADPACVHAGNLARCRDLASVYHHGLKTSLCPRRRYGVANLALPHTSPCGVSGLIHRLKLHRAERRNRCLVVRLIRLLR